MSSTPQSLPEARRWPGSEWLKNRPHFWEIAYQQTARLLRWSYPWLKRISPRLSERVLHRAEQVGKGYLFNCQMCGQCILHSTGMTCPMTCPKNLRNGPCGGVRADGRCEVIPERMCVWVQAWERSQQMPIYGAEIQLIQPPLNHTLPESTAWINLLEGHDQQMPPGWQLRQSITRNELG